MLKLNELVSLFLSSGQLCTIFGFVYIYDNKYTSKKPWHIGMAYVGVGYCYGLGRVNAGVMLFVFSVIHKTYWLGFCGMLGRLCLNGNWITEKCKHIIKGVFCRNSWVNCDTSQFHYAFEFLQSCISLVTQLIGQ